jgi:hypothetical protein
MLSRLLTSDSIRCGRRRIANNIAFCSRSDHVGSSPKIAAHQPEAWSPCPNHSSNLAAACFVGLIIRGRIQDSLLHGAKLCRMGMRTRDQALSVVFVDQARRSGSRLLRACAKLPDRSQHASSCANASRASAPLAARSADMPFSKQRAYFLRHVAATPDRSVSRRGAYHLGCVAPRCGRGDLPPRRVSIRPSRWISTSSRYRVSRA